jgi:ketosteroid isomerase-like protein
MRFIAKASGGAGPGELVDVIGAGDRVVVIIRRVGIEGGGSGEQGANLTTFRDGKAVEMVHYPDPADALAATGR